MTFLELAENRVSHRNYDPEKPVNEAILRKIAKAGVLAPSAVNAQPWEFLFISNPELKEQIHQAYNRDWFHNAPHILVVKGNIDFCWSRKYDGYRSLETDLAIAMDHMILAAESMDVSTCWIAAFDPEKLSKALDLKENERVFAITPLGYPKGEDVFVEKKRKEWDQVVKFL